MVIYRALSITLLMLLGTPITDSDAQEVPPALNTEEVALLVTSILEADAESFLLKERDGPTEDSFRVSFTLNKDHYTVAYNWYAPGLGFWVRLNEVNQSPDFFADTNMDGIVDFGTDDGPTIFRPNSGSPDGAPDIGLTHQDMWQGMLNRALAGLDAIKQKELAIQSLPPP